jgi:hypothetical protein
MPFFCEEVLRSVWATGMVERSHGIDCCCLYTVLRQRHDVNAPRLRDRLHTMRQKARAIKAHNTKYRLLAYKRRSRISARNELSHNRLCVLNTTSVACSKMEHRKCSHSYEDTRHITIAVYFTLPVLSFT